MRPKWNLERTTNIQDCHLALLMSTCQIKKFKSYKLLEHKLELELLEVPEAQRLMDICNCSG